MEKFPCECGIADYMCDDGWTRTNNNQLYCEPVSSSARADGGADSREAKCAALRWWETKVQISHGYKLLPGNKCKISDIKLNKFEPTWETCTAHNQSRWIVQSAYSLYAFRPLLFYFLLAALAVLKVGVLLTVCGGAGASGRGKYGSKAAYYGNSAYDSDGSNFNIAQLAPGGEGDGVIGKVKAVGMRVGGIALGVTAGVV